MTNKIIHPTSSRSTWRPANPTTDLARALDITTDEKRLQAIWRGDVKAERVVGPPMYGVEGSEGRTDQLTETFI